MKALLTERALRRLTPGEYRFCADAGCEIVYFGTADTFATDEVRVGVSQKLPFGNRPLCYCFGESDGSIRAEMVEAGRSSAIERIRGCIAAGRCACEIRNPRGACCLGDVMAAIKRIESTLPQGAGSHAGEAIEHADDR